jgi:hypothetical protein
VSLRNSNRVVLGKVIDGAATELATAPLTVTRGRPYRVRLETRGPELTASVDEQPMLYAVDRTLTHGVSGFSGYQTRYDVDNVMVSPFSMTTFRTGFEIYLEAWTTRGKDWHVVSTPAGLFYAQSDTNIEGHAVVGEATDDQIVISRVRADAFSTSTTAGWVGVMARYVDNLNYYSLCLRSNGQVQIRRKLAGVVSVLKGRQFPVTAGRLYDLRLDAVGNKLRAYVDGVLQLEIADTELPRGRSGLATYKAGASFADYDAYQP